MSTTPRAGVHNDPGMGGPHANRHRRVLSAVEGSAAQDMLLAGLESLNGVGTEPGLQSLAVGSSNNSVPDLHPSFSQWNSAATSKSATFQNPESSQWDNGEEDGLLLPPTPTMDIMETTSSVAATGPASTSSQRSILSNYSGSSEDGLEVDEENGNELAGLNVSNSSQPANPIPILFPNRALRIQAQLVHQRRLQNAAKAHSPTVSAVSAPQVVVGKEELHSMMEGITARIDKSMQDILTQQRKDFDRVTSLLQSESQKHTAIESRLHAQLILQSESMVAMELKLLRLEAKMQQKSGTQRMRFPVIDEEEGLHLEGVPARTTHVLSSGASLVSAVTATSGLEDGGVDEDEDEEEEGGVAVSSVEGDHPNADVDEQSSSTPTQLSNPRQNSDSILLNPIPPLSSGISETGESNRAIRPMPPSEGSSLATSVTTSTLPSTVVTQNNPNPHGRGTLSRGRSAGEMDDLLGERVPGGSAARSRSQSPLTVPSMATASFAPSVGSTSVLTTGAVASSREFRTRRSLTNPSIPAQDSSTRPLTNRVVSFVSDEPQYNEVLDTGSQADTLTLPDDIDNLSDIVDAFAASSNRWREEYEARLDAIQKRFSRD